MQKLVKRCTPKYCVKRFPNSRAHVDPSHPSYLFLHKSPLFETFSCAAVGALIGGW